MDTLATATTTTISTEVVTATTTVIIGLVVSGLYYCYYYNNYYYIRHHPHHTTITKKSNTNKRYAHQSRLIQNQFGLYIDNNYINDNETITTIIHHDLHLQEQEHPSQTIDKDDDTNTDKTIGGSNNSNSNTLHNTKATIKEDEYHGRIDTKVEEEIDDDNNNNDEIKVIHDAVDTVVTERTSVTAKTPTTSHLHVEKQYDNNKCDDTSNDNNDNNNNKDVDENVTSPTMIQSQISPSKQEKHQQQQQQKQKQYTRQYIQNYKRHKVIEAVESRLRSRINNEHTSQSLSSLSLQSFCHWYDQETKYFRQYILYPKVKENHIGQHEEEIQLYNNSNNQNHTWKTNIRTGMKEQQTIQIHVTNDLLNEDEIIYVYWYDNTRNHTKRDSWNNKSYLIPKGTIIPKGGIWYQTTFINHHWIFKMKQKKRNKKEQQQQQQGEELRDCPLPSFADNGMENVQQDDNEEVTILHYIPCNEIPITIPTTTTTTAATRAFMEYDMTNTEMTNSTSHRFHIVPNTKATQSCVSTEETTTATATSDNIEVVDNFYCSIYDPILPYPSLQHILNIRKAGEYAIQYCTFMKYPHWNILQKYIYNIILHARDDDDYQSDKEQQYRRIRTMNETFYNCVWNTPAKGVLLAYGFVEIESEGYVYLFGDNNSKNYDNLILDPLSKEIIYEFELLYHMLQLAEQKRTTT